jgi:hypothetical protein
LDNISNILLELSNVPEVREDIDQGIKNIYKNKFITTLTPARRSLFTPVPRRQEGGTFKNKKIRNSRKTKNNKKSINNKKGSIKKREKKVKRNTRRS